MMLDRSRRYRQIYSRLLFYSFIIFVTVVFTFPIYWFITTSFKKPVDILSVPPSWTFTPTLKNYAELFKVQKFQRNILNSTIISSSVVVLSLVLGVPAAYALSRMTMRGKHVLQFWILTSRMIPPMALAVPFFMIFSKAHLLNHSVHLLGDPPLANCISFFSAKCASPLNSQNVLLQESKRISSRLLLFLFLYLNHQLNQMANPCEAS